METEKSKTTNIADLIHEFHKGGKKKVGGKPFENTHDISKLKKHSFFSQSKDLCDKSCWLDNIEDDIFSNEDGEEEEDLEGILTPCDERAQGGKKEGGQKGKKIPFSFLMHHYLKSNEDK